MKRIERKCILFLINFLFSVQLLYSQSNDSNQSGVTKIKDGIYLLTDYGCNIIISQGSDGLLIIDTGLKDLELKLDSAIAVFSDLPVQYVLNTHFHFDHAGGNHVFGAKGAIIVAHENSRKHMESAWKVPEIVEIQFPTIPPYPKTALPKICFNNSLKIHFNNDTIYALHYPKGHSDSDAFYFFCNANLIHTGDLFLSNGFTFIDVFTGGSINAYIEAVKEIIHLCNDKTVIIPGHGPVSNRKGLMDFLELLIKSRDRIRRLIVEGKTLDEVLKANPLEGLYSGGESWLPPELFIYALYTNLSR